MRRNCVVWVMGGLGDSGEALRDEEVAVEDVET
jgi:hypothetical protein